MGSRYAYSASGGYEFANRPLDETLDSLYNARMDLSFHHENLAKHNVSPDEVEEVFEDPNSWSEKSYGGAYLHLGKTGQGRLLEVGYRKVTHTSAFVFHAMDARDSQRKRYKKRS